MKSEYRVVVIGGGVVGASILYHLTKMGWADVAIVERSVLTAGSSWHAAGGIHALNADPNIAALQAYTIDLLSDIGEESGHGIGMHMTGGIPFASAPERWEWLQSTYRVYQTMGIEDTWLMSPDEIKERCPIINTDGVYGGLWADREGYIDPSATVHAYAKAAKIRGGEVIEHTRVIELNQRPNWTWDVVTEQGTIHAEHIVNAELWLDNLMSARLPSSGRIKLAPMLGHDGRLKGDLTVLNWGDGTWWIMGSYYLREWHMRWFNGHMTDGVQLRDISDAIVGFGLSGPKSRELLELVTHDDVSHEAFGFMRCRFMDVGLIRAKVGRISVTGELGYEIHCASSDHIALRRALLEAGREVGAVEYGFNAMGSLRMEKSFGIWSTEFRQEYTPGMTGMDRWIDWSKEFIGSGAALKERESGAPRMRQVTLEVDSVDAEADGYEPVWNDGERIGYITSGEFGHAVGKSLAMALIEPELAAPGTELSTHIVGVEYPTRVIESSPYDPSGLAMRL